MRDTVQGRLDSLKSAIEGVSISLFSMNQGPLSDAIERTTEWVRANEEVIASNLGGWIAKIIDNFQSITDIFTLETFILNNDLFGIGSFKITTQFKFLSIYKERYC